MKSFIAAAAFVGAAVAVPGAVTSAISPSASAPAGCQTSYNGQFEISIANVSSNEKRSLQARQSTPLEITLKNGVLTDSKGRTGYIASNQQFQFDGPPQAGAIYTSGFSACPNGTLALGGSTVFYKCLSGTFYNLYDDDDAAQCSPVFIDILGGSSATGGVSQLGDGQVTGNPVTQITDGQIQATTGAAVAQITDGQIQATTAAAVSQISDGQIQATTAAAPVSQITDGQIQAPTGNPVSQISDGQIQAPTGNYSTPKATSTPEAFTGAASFVSLRTELFALAAGVLAIAAL